MFDSLFRGLFDSDLTRVISPGIFCSAWGFLWCWGW